MGKPREGSKKRALYDYMLDNGMNGAEAFGIKDLMLNKGLVRRWLKKWSALTPTRPKGTPVISKLGVLSERDRVVDLGNAGRVGILVKLGQEVSEVRWDDGWMQYMSNDMLRRSK